MGVGVGLGLDLFLVVFGDFEEVGLYDVVVVCFGDDDFGLGGVVVVVVFGYRVGYIEERGGGVIDGKK